MTLSEVHANPELLAKFLGVPFEETTEFRPSYRGYAHSQTITVTAAERVADAYTKYQTENNYAWSKSAANPYKPQTWAQFVAECCREALGIRKGKVSEKLDYARMSRPDLYQPA